MQDKREEKREENARGRQSRRQWPIDVDYADRRAQARVRRCVAREATPVADEVCVQQAAHGRRPP